MKYIYKKHENLSLFLYLHTQKEVKKILNHDKKKYSTKIFSYPANYYNLSNNDNGFKCGLEKYGLNYNEMHKSKIFDTHFDINQTHNIDVKLSDMLIPDLDLNIRNEDYINILSHEGYQLKWFKEEESFYH